MSMSEEAIRKALEGQFTYYVGRPNYTEVQQSVRQARKKAVDEQAKRRVAIKTARAMREFKKACDERMTAEEPDYRQIIAAVALAHQLNVCDLLGPSRKQPIKVARHHAMWELRQRKPSFSLGKIGQHMGSRDHTTVLNSLDYFQSNGHRHAAQVEAVATMLKVEAGKGAREPSAACPSQPQVD